MAEIGISIAEKLIEVIGSEVVTAICDIWGYKAELEGLNTTVNTIKNVLVDADSKRELTNTERDYVEELKAAVYDADDLFDEFLTLAELKKLDGNKDDDKFLKKLRRFFSSKKKGMTQAYRMSRKVKEIKRQLDSVASNYTKYKVSFDTKPVRQKRKETFSYLTNRRAIVGREDDKKAVLDKLLAPNGGGDDDDDVRFLTVVGTGGVGKTTLAKLVYNDTKVLNEFLDSTTLRLWVCVSDQDGQKFDGQDILCKIIALVSSEDKKKIDGTSTLEEVKNLFVKNLEGKKYLLVLDDVWNESRDEWLVLESLLKIGQSGSRILITTRSEKTATIIGNKLFHKLEGLSPENSWNLFKILAFDQGREPLDHDELVAIGRRIVAKCHNVPLAIEVVGSLLYGSDITRWRSFEKSALSEIGNGDNKIMSILKLSYHNLEYSLKSCFTYCALFPKDTSMEKETLISLWLAQGYIVPFDGGQSLEDAAEQHFLTLLQRCFFQNVKQNDYGDVTSVEIHDLMHDVAQEVGLREICVSSCSTSKMGDKIRHVRCAGERCPESSVFKSKIRSYICRLHEKSVIEKSHRIIESWMCLRVLELEKSNLEKLPDWIGKLLHLRYLNLNFNRHLETLPDSITELHNLQTLRLSNCHKLRELPKGISKLVKLRHLDLEGCYSLATLPASLDKLTNLRQLPYVVIGKGKCDGEFGLGNLKHLTAIKGQICIKMIDNEEGIDNHTGGCLKSLKYLTQVDMDFKRHDEPSVYQERMMEKMEPHSNLKELTLNYYSGGIIPRWGIAQSNWANSLPLLVHIRLSFCRCLEQIPSLSKLRCLKTLQLCCFEKLEYMEDTSNTISRSDDGEDSRATFFPSLESLVIHKMDSLKGWWRGEELSEEGGHIVTRSFRFPRLSKLTIIGCPNLASFPLCPVLQELHLLINGNMLSNLSRISTQQGKNQGDSVGVSHGGSEVSGLNSLVIDRVDYQESIFFLTGQSNISEDGQISGKSLNQNLLSLKFNFLKDTHFPNVASDFQYLTSLHTLEFNLCSKLEALPEWIGDLPSLQHLIIRHCNALLSLPESMKKLTSLQTLKIGGSRSKLVPHVKELTKILHIPNIQYSDL